ncbi:MAG: cyclodeaminase/cyclohydrolase family protein [Candidatus Omnitrophota bacterium]
MYRTEPLQKYLDDLSSRMPAPGGGSSAALSGAMAAALFGMVLNFTIGNPKYGDFEKRAKDILKISEGLRSKFTDLFEEDMVCFRAVSEAYKLPKETDPDKEKRKKAISDGLKKALMVPLQVCRLSVEAIKLCPELARDANKSMICDVEVPVRLLESAFYSARINVVMNQKGIQDSAFNEKVSKEIIKLEEELLNFKKISEGEIVKITGGH